MVISAGNGYLVGKSMHEEQSWSYCGTQVPWDGANQPLCHQTLRSRLKVGWYTVPGPSSNLWHPSLGLCIISTCRQSMDYHSSDSRTLSCSENPFIEVKLIGLIGGELRQIHRGRAEMEKGLEKNLTQSLLKPIRDTRPEIDSQDKIDLITSEPGWAQICFFHLYSLKGKVLSNRLWINQQNDS